MVEERIREELDRRQEALRSTEHGTWFLDEVRGRAGAVKTLAAEEQLVDAAAERLREHQEAEARRSARKRELFELPGGEDVLDALLNGLDPRRSDRRETTVENFDKALTEAFSDRQRLGRLRDALADPEDAARYREVLEARGRTFTIKDIDAAIEAVLRHRADAERERKAKEARQRARKEQQQALRAAESTEYSRVQGGDVALILALDRQTPNWLAAGVNARDLDRALGIAERNPDPKVVGHRTRARTRRRAAVPPCRQQRLVGGP